MTVRSSTIRAQSGAISSAVVAALGGFVAGVLVVGLPTFERSVPGTGESLRSSVQYHPAQPAVEFPAASTQALQPRAASLADPWNFEVGTPQARNGPGRKRPDLLSAPEGWVYDAGPATH